MHDLPARSHPLRASLAAEMHVRRLPHIDAPCRMVQIVALTDADAARDGRAIVEQLAARDGRVLSAGARFCVLGIDGSTLVWEGHTEFASWMLIHPGSFERPFDDAILGPAERALIAGIPGQVIRATRIALLPQGSALPDRAAAARWFDPAALTLCDVAHGHARILSDFKLHADGYGRLLIADQGLEGDEAAQLVMRLQELGNYRNMALLGLPMAQSLTPQVSTIEARLAALTHQVSERGASDDTLLDELTAVAAELARLVADTRYRMSATRAYAQLSMERLASLGIGAVRGFQTLADFTERRLAPALRTCESFAARLEDLQQRTAWTSSLLRTRIDIALAKQNRDLLESMDRRTRMQLRLQQAVEGLSVVAISYYLVSLIGYAGYPLFGEARALAMAVAVPVVVAGVWLAAHRLRRQLRE
ncbi:DUF3422 family protein [Sphingomonas baiyangensis]|uniref:DUF3422 domain-containing protein n=1 Tax=Sphingomonas baiyangensis TaxID=2572576 RepID=A0A4U1L474_9SPHN|nr:DUF3422 domain-containing protein [Sphingomonas baiyangensis]TKD50946.1 DUF3422 domain-containing protein [Sphingomonas baiyangensis]